MECFFAVFVEKYISATANRRWPIGNRLLRRPGRPVSAGSRRRGLRQRFEVEFVFVDEAKKEGRLYEPAFFYFFDEMEIT